MTSAPRPPIVLLHGCGGSLHSTFEATGWLDAIAAQGRSSIPLHLPGHGASSASRDPATYADLAGLIARDLPPGSFDAVGFSLGAKLLLELAIRHPERIGRLVLGGVGDNVFAPERIADAAAQALESGPGPDPPPPVRAFLQTWEPHRNDALAVAAVLRRSPNPTFTPERLQRIASPVLIVNGSTDPITQLGNRLVGCLACVQDVTLPDVDHFGLPRQPAFIRCALDFLSANEQERHPAP